MSAIRLNKFLADAGVASRRGADELIFAGRVRVNDETVREPGRRVRPGQDRVFCGGKEVGEKTPPTYIMLNKPVHVVCTVSDPQGRQTVLDLLPDTLTARRIFPVGRLDYMSEGLLLLTSDGPLTQRLTHPRFEHRKVYEALVRGRVPEQALQTMRKGMRLREGEQLAPVEAEASVRPDGNSLLRLVLRQGVNRQIRRMCRDLDLTILRLYRVEFGPLTLGNLASGKWRLLTSAEIAALKSTDGTK
jgi:23S rRNA pseudouridine2605 synthase